MPVVGVRRRRLRGPLEPLERLRQHVALAIEPARSARRSRSAASARARPSPAPGCSRRCRRRRAAPGPRLYSFSASSRPERFVAWSRMLPKTPSRSPGAARLRRRERRGRRLDVVEHDAEIDFRVLGSATGATAAAAARRSRRGCCRDRWRSRSARSACRSSSRRAGLRAGFGFRTGSLGLGRRPPAGPPIRLLTAAPARAQAAAPRSGVARRTGRCS